MGAGIDVFMFALDARAAERVLDLQTFKSHSRVVLHLDQGVQSTWKDDATGFEITLKGIGLEDLGAPMGAEKQWLKQFESLSDDRVQSIQIKNAGKPGGEDQVVISGKWKFAPGDKAPAERKMEHFQFRSEKPPTQNFDFWLKEFNHFLPSPQTRWCTRQLKLEPFKQWIRPSLKAGIKITSYVAIRSDEDHREGLKTQDPNLIVVMPFRESGIDKQGVIEILEGSGLGMPAYYRWRSRSGCTFCFFQQKIEWVRLKREHPDSFEEAKSYEKSAISHGSPFTWSQGESLEDLEKPERILEIESDFEARRQRELAKKLVNPLRPIKTNVEDIDDLYGEDEGGGACLVCHK